MDDFKTIAEDIGFGAMWLACACVGALLLWVCLLGSYFTILWAQGEIYVGEFHFWDVVSPGPIFLVGCVGVICWAIGKIIRSSTTTTGSITN